MRALGFAAACAGFAAMLAQMCLLRELLSVFAGNELTLGLILGLWLILMGFGSYLAARTHFSGVYAFKLSLAISIPLLPATIFLSRALGTYLIAGGEIAGLSQIIRVCILAMGAYGLVYGFQFATACSILAGRKGTGLNAGYILDSLGSALGAVAFTFLLSGSLNSFNIAYIAALADAAGLFLLGGRARFAAAGLALAIVLAASALNLQDVTNSMQYGGMRVLAQENTRFGNIAVVESAGQVSFFENGAPLFSAGNAAQAEETVHYAMAQRSGAKSVLLIGGGLSGAVREILKYPVERVDYVELDPELVRLARGYVRDESLEDGRVRIINEDGRLYVKRARDRYDVVIVGLPDPTTAQLNRFYTAEFYLEARGIMSPGGVLSTSLTSSADYMGQDAKRLNAGQYSTLKEAFGNVIVLPAGRNIFLASDSALDYNISALIKSAGVDTEYVNGYFLGGTLTPDRIRYLDEAVSGGGQVDSDIRPVAYHQYLRYWLAHFGQEGNLAVLAAILLAISLAFYLRLKPADANILAVGFTATSLEVVLLLSLQSAWGFVYSQVGLIMAAFMGGLVLGAYAAGRIADRTGCFGGIILLAAAYSALLPALILASPSLPPAAARVIYPIAALALGGLVGALFPAAAATRYRDESPSVAAGSILGLDFLGAAAGSLVTSVLLIPTVGIITVCAFMALLNLGGWLRLKIG